MRNFFEILFSQPIVATILVTDVIVLIGILIFFLLSLKKGSASGYTALSDVDRITKAAQQSLLHAHNEAASASPAATDAWKEYAKTLFQTTDATTIHSTDDAENFFNERTLAPDLFKNSLLAAVPSMLTAVGVLATFLGLTFGLLSVDISADADADALMEGINGLISSAGVSFVTSVVGVSTSLFATYILKRRERSLQTAIAALEATVDDRFKRYSAEDGLYRTDRNTRESAESLAHLHEKIGAQLQTAVSGLSSDMQAAFISAMDQVLAPALAELTTSTAQQSAEVFENLVGRFSGAFEQMGTSHATAMQSASHELVQTVSDLRDGFSQSLTELRATAQEDRSTNAAVLADIRTATAEQVAEMQRAARAQADDDRAASAALMDEMRAAHTSHLKTFRDEAAEQTHALQAQMSDLSTLAQSQQESSSRTIEQFTQLSNNTRESLESAAEHLSVTSARLESIAAQFTTANDVATTSITQATRTMESLAQRQSQSLEALDRHSAGIDRLSQLSGSAADRLSAAASEAKTSFATLSEQQTQFLSGMETALTTAQEKLVRDIESASEQMSGWLQAYSDAVRTQTNERLGEWNSQTTEFASTMLATSHALSAVVDEIQGKAVHGSAPQTVR